MIKFIWNLLALIGLLIVAAIIAGYVRYGEHMPNILDLPNLRDFDKEAGIVYLDMSRTLLETGNAAEATVWKVPVDDGISTDEVDEIMKFVANERNIKNVGELPLSEQITAMTGENFPFLKIYMFCNPLTAGEMFEYSMAFSAYLPCRISLIEDNDGKLWLYTLNMDMMIHGGYELPTDLKAEALEVKDIMLDIMNRGATGEF